MKMHQIAKNILIAAFAFLLFAVLALATDIYPLEGLEVSSVTAFCQEFFAFNQLFFTLVILGIVFTFSLYLFEVFRKNYLNLVGLIASCTFALFNVIVAIFGLMRLTALTSDYRQLDLVAINEALAKYEDSYAASELYLKLPLPFCFLLIAASLFFAAMTVVKYRKLHPGGDRDVA